jgi:hypothetical protein
MVDSAKKTATLREQQFAFAAHLRNPEAPPPAGIEDRRMAVYRRLFINNVTSFLRNSFPVLANLLGEERWKMLIRDYYRDHKSHTPLFPEMPKEFLDYLNNERADGHHSDPLSDPPFMFELAHYEWVETGLALATENNRVPGLSHTGDLLDDCPVTSGLAWLVSYAYPVNEIGRDNQPEQPAEQPLHYIVYRDDAFKVHFLKLNVISARLFEILSSEKELSGRQALKKIAIELQHNQPEIVIQAGAQMLDQWRLKGIVIGTLPATRAVEEKPVQ